MPITMLFPMCMYASCATKLISDERKYSAKQEKTIQDILLPLFSKYVYSDLLYSD